MLMIRSSLEELIVSGGNERMLVLPTTQRNMYNIPPTPVPKAILRGSCTCMPLAEVAYEKIGVFLRMLQEVPDDRLETELSKHFSKLRDDIRNVFRPPKPCPPPFVFLSPSGTDCELVVTSLAVARSRTIKSRTGVSIIIVGGGELGSGTVMASEGRAFGKSFPFLR